LRFFSFELPESFPSGTFDAIGVHEKFGIKKEVYNE